MALAFEGDPEFIRTSCNFAANFLLDSKANIYQMTPTFAIVNTTMENLTAALEFEGYLQKMLELRTEARKVHGSVFDLLQPEDYPADYDEKCDAYMRAILAANSPEDVADAEKLNPHKNLDELPDEVEKEMERQAKAYGKEYAAKELAKLHFEDFMRHVNRAGLSVHEFSEQTP
jgi:hypothetical protein